MVWAMFSSWVWVWLCGTKDMDLGGVTQHYFVNNVAFKK